MKLHRYASTLSEVQAAVAQSRKWLDQGVSPSDIAILHPNMEDVWPTLSEYFRIEGIPCDKSIVTKVLLHPEMQLLNSKLKLMAGEVDRSLLESVLFEAAPQMLYKNFVRRYHNFYGAYQTEDDPEIQSFIQNLSNHNFSLQDFLDVVIKKFGGQKGLWLKPIVQRMMSEVPSDIEWPFKLWIQYFERLLVKTEIVLERGVDDGLKILNLESADWLSAEYIWVMGLNEEALKSFEPMGLSVREVLSLSQQTGFQLPLPDQRHKEFEALWLLEREVRELHLSTSANDLSGQAQAASLIWLEKSVEFGLSHEHLEQPESTRLSELQNQDQAQSLPHQFGPFEITRLSATQIEKYLDCPFIFAAEKVFNLSNDPALDLDLDHRMRGLLLHALFEKLAIEPMKFDLSENEVGELLEQIKDRVQLGEKEFWPSIKKKYIKIGSQFLEFEKEWRKRFPQTQTVARELEIKALWSQKQKRFIKEGDGIPFLGRIDRVDQNVSRDVVLIDYKSSSHNLFHWSSWISNAKLQLGIYMLAVEDGVTSLEHSPVVGALYYVLKDKKREKGFRLEDTDESLFSSVDKIKNWLSPTQKAKFLNELRELVFNTVENIQKGEFYPNPRDQKLCELCAWRKLCRAPHLN